MNYRHAFHAGNHADVLKHVVLLALVEALQRKDTPIFVLDTHAGRGRYDLAGAQAGRTGEAEGGIKRLLALARDQRPSAGSLRAQAADNAGPAPLPRGPGALPEPVLRYLDAVRACNPDGGCAVYPGSPLLLAQALRAHDRLACCELHEEEAAALKALLAGDARVGVHRRDGYGALAALLPPKEKRGLALIDPPYEAQEAEYGAILAALAEGLRRWPQGVYALWYPIKQRRTLRPFFRKAAVLPAKSALLLELLVRPDDSPLRMNGSGMLLLNPPWRLDAALAPVLPALVSVLGEAGASSRLEWLRHAD